MQTPTPTRWLHLLVIILFLECAALVGAVVFLLVELVIDRPDSYASALALTITVAVAAIGVGVIALNTLRRRPWVRGAAMVWQVLQIAVAIGSFQGDEARPDIGWALLAPAILAIVLLFTPSVMALTVRPRREYDDDGAERDGDGAELRSEQP